MPFPFTGADLIMAAEQKPTRDESPLRLRVARAAALLALGVVALSILMQSGPRAKFEEIVFVLVMIAVGAFTFVNRVLVLYVAVASGVVVFLDFAPYRGDDAVSRGIQRYAEHSHPIESGVKSDFMAVQKVLANRTLVDSEIQFLNTILVVGLLLLIATVLDRLLILGRRRTTAE